MFLRALSSGYPGSTRSDRVTDAQTRNLALTVCGTLAARLDSDVTVTLGTPEWGERFGGGVDGGNDLRVHRVGRANTADDRQVYLIAVGIGAESRSRAAALILSGVQGGSQTMSTSACLTPGIFSISSLT